MSEKGHLAKEKSTRESPPTHTHKGPGITSFSTVLILLSCLKIVILKVEKSSFYRETEVSV
jgi:hypothetical protein